MIRIIKILALAMMLSVTTAWADEPLMVATADINEDVLQSITSRTKEAVGTVLEAATMPLIGVKDIQCLARNIFYEAANEPEEGMVAVGLVTLNRASAPDYPRSVCGVVNQRTVLDVPKTITKTVTTKVGWFGNTQTRKVTSTKMTKLTVCQFSWSCMGVKTPKKDDPRWIESQRVAMALANVDYEEYDDWRGKYANAMHFHAVNVHPGWRLKRITRVGGHIFYE